MRTMNPSRLLCCPLLTILILLVLASSLEADVKKRSVEGEKKEKKEKRPEISIPEAKSAVIQFVESRSVDFELVAATSSLQQVEFLIREQPKYGILKNFRINPRANNRVHITYQHTGRADQLRDSFVFACRVGNSPVSAPATIELRGVPNAPDIEVVTPPRFGETFLGTSSSATFMILNRGTDVFVKEMSWPPPFEGPQRIVVEPGKTFSGELRFTPDKEMTYREEIELQPGRPKSELQLLAEGAQSLTVSPGLLELEYDQVSGERVGEVTLVNRRDEDVTITLEDHKRIKKVEPIAIPPLGSKKVAIAVPSEDVDAVDLILAVSGAITKYELKLVAKPSPGKIEFIQLKGKALDFGLLKQGEKKSLSVIVQNNGGEDIVAGLKITPPFKLSESSNLLRLSSKKMKMFDIELEGSGEGNVAGVFEISGSTQNLVLQLRGQIEPKSDPKADSITNPNKHMGLGSSSPRVVYTTDGERVRSRQEMRLMSLLMTQGVPIPKEMINPKLPSVERIDADEVTKHSVVLTWTASDPQPDKWIIQFSRMVHVKEYDMPIKVWSLVKQYSVEQIDTDTFRATVQGLSPKSQYEFRVLACDENNKLSNPNATVLLATLSGPHINPWWWRISLCIGLIVLIRHLRRKRLGLE